ncbi:SDR family oxidoreductase [Clostridium sp. SYSU_GA19001]|uniref:SDR family NAD(P)-dependent oxidoreductase n=1 Tax=Clostridium caldaquaticum TaxID=2940653 RepID=UPI002076E156|nr:glucose 1-dehydrogenase [Clostridium caldaquaticum]MCM8711242.1 SDR family oxidoreductase [Clostridium caldaquaticum]
MQDIFSLKGKNAVVVGGAGGIGQAIAKGLAFYGANVAIASRNLESLNRAAKEIEEEVSVKIKVFQVDAANEESIKSLAQNVAADMGRVDILVNSQGYNKKYDAIEFPMDVWDDMFDVNVKGVMMCCKEFAKLMIPNKYGKIINVSSVRGARACGGGNAAYCSTKGALDMLTRVLCVELAPYNITVNAIGPTITETPMMKDIMNKNLEIKNKILGNIPMGRMGEKDDVIGTAVFLASDASRFVTGQVIYTDGGQTAAV